MVVAAVQQQDVRPGLAQLLRRDAREILRVLAAVALVPQRSAGPFALLRPDELIFRARGAQLLVKRQPVGDEGLPSLRDRIAHREDPHRLGGDGAERQDEG